MTTRQTHSVAVLEVSRPVFDEIAKKLRAAGYDHVFASGREFIDMHGIAVAPTSETTDLTADAVDPALVVLAELNVAQFGENGHTYDEGVVDRMLDVIRRRLVGKAQP